MKRDAVDLSIIRPEHTAIHKRLHEWSRWCRTGGGGSAMLPMFEGYRNGYEEPAVRGVPVDVNRCIQVQTTFKTLPEKHRLVLGWWYCEAWVPVLVIRRRVGLSTPDLYEMVHDSRTMMKNKMGVLKERDSAPSNA